MTDEKERPDPLQKRRPDDDGDAGALPPVESTDEPSQTEAFEEEGAGLAAKE